MQKKLKSVVVVIFAVVLSFALLMGPPAQADKYDKKKPNGPKVTGPPTPVDDNDGDETSQVTGPPEQPGDDGDNKPIKSKRTIMETLNHIDGIQALLAAINVVDEVVNDGKLGELLDDRSAKLVLLAPSNVGFAQFLGKSPKAMDGLDADTIASVLPILLNQVGLDEDALYDILLKHVSVVEKGSPPSLMDLLTRGNIPVEDGSVFLVSIGDRGVCINYESCITQHDVYTVNGVIDYLDKVIVDVPEEDPPPPNEVCDQEKCLLDAEVREQCDNFLETCLIAAQSPGGPSEEECVAGGLLICNEHETEIEP